MSLQFCVKNQLRFLGRANGELFPICQRNKADWKAKHENEITVRMKSQWWRRLLGRQRCDLAGTEPGPPGVV